MARILIDSIIDKQGLLRPGDVIVEANGQKIKNPEQLQEVWYCTKTVVVSQILSILNKVRFENDFLKRPTIYSYQVLAGGNDDEFIVFKIQPSATEDYIMDDNQIAKPKPGKVAKV